MGSDWSQSRVYMRVSFSTRGRLKRMLQWALGNLPLSCLLFTHRWIEIIIIIIQLHKLIRVFFFSILCVFSSANLNFLKRFFLWYYPKGEMQWYKRFKEPRTSIKRPAAQLLRGLTFMFSLRSPANYIIQKERTTSHDDNFKILFLCFVSLFTF